MTPVYVPTKPYIKEWLVKNVPGGVVDRRSYVGSILIPLLESDTDHFGTKSVSYPVTATLRIKPDPAIRFGGWLNVTQAMMFNNALGKHVRELTRMYVLTYLEFDPRLKKAIEYAQSRMHLCEELMPYESIKKDFQRYRQKHGGPTIYRPRKQSSLVN